MINDAFGADRYCANEVHCTSNEDIDEGEGTPNVTQESTEAKEFYELAKDGEQPLFEGCTKYSKLSFLVKLYHIKCMCGMSDKAMTMILELLQDAFQNAKIPSSFYEAKKTITKLSLNYDKIHACPNNCMLYWDNNDDEARQTCRVCNNFRWQSMTKDSETKISGDGDEKKKKVPAKVLLCFPLKPRLHRLFLSSKIAKNMRWHATDSNDGMMRHSRDSESLKKFDAINTSFALDPRNVRLALATDGFNSYGSLNASYSIWPVILISYYTPPWVCMKQISFIISMISPGKRMPRNDIDVYLQPLIKELKELWDEGVDVYDAYKQEMFKLHAALMWTISDFPGLGNLSGWNTSTGLACPSCNFDAVPFRLPHSKKWCFMGHRRFLDHRHRFRLNKIRFNGEQEMRSPPKRLSGSKILEQVKDIDVMFGRRPEVEGSAKRMRGGRVVKTGTEQWKKKSIFFELSYWKDNLLHHNLDVMHIEKNVCNNIICTLLNDSGKTKDHVNARKDLKAMGIKSDLWPNESKKDPLAIFTMTRKGKKAFLTTLRNITMPDGY